MRRQLSGLALSSSPSVWAVVPAAVPNLHSLQQIRGMMARVPPSAQRGSAALTYWEPQRGVLQVGVREVIQHQPTTGHIVCHPVDKGGANARDPEEVTCLKAPSWAQGQ
jgi:hypothetical protein